MKNLILLIRPWQWTKSLFVVLPMFFAAQIANGDCWASVAPAFAAMCLVASAIYCINDIVDAEADRQHPRKCHRPIASGVVSQAQGYAVAASLLVAAGAIVALTLPSAVATKVCAMLGAYLILNIAYCLRLKHIAIIDVFCIGIGFALRIFIGGFATGIWVSPWLVCMTLLLTLFLGFAKRRDDVVQRQAGTAISRHSSEGYNLVFLDQTIGLLAAISMICYIIYTMQPEVEARFGCPWVYTTSVFVLAGILRYLQIIFVKQQSGEPSKVLLHDRPLQLCIALWAISFVIIIYAHL